MTRIVIIGSGVEEARKALFGEARDQACKEIADAMVAQARRNIITEGGPGGRWAPLSGFNQGRENKRAAKSTIKGLKQGGVGLDDLDAKRAAQLRRDAGSSERHTGYAKAKEKGWTPGKGKHGADERLVDTDGLIKGLVAKTTLTNDGAVIELTAEGTAPNGTPYAQVLEYHAEGTATMPARNPAENMAQVEKRAKEILQAALDRAAKRTA